MLHATPDGATVVTPHDATYLAIASFLAGYGNKSTRDLYTIDLRIFTQWCADHDLRPLVDVKRVHLELFGRHLEQDRGNGAATVAHRLGVVRTFYEHCERDELIDRNPARHVKLPKIWSDKTKKVGLDRYEMSAYLNTARQAGPHPHALIVLLAMLGLRVTETCNIHIPDFLGRGTIQGHRVLTLTRKGGKPDTTPLPPAVWIPLDTCAGDRATGPLLLTRRGTPMDRHAAYWTVTQLAKKAGLNKHVHPHLLRNSFVTLCLQAGVPISKVQRAAAHEDPKTTMAYDLARQDFDGHANHTLSAYLAVGS